MNRLIRFDDSQEQCEVIEEKLDGGDDRQHDKGQRDFSTGIAEVDRELEIEDNLQETSRLPNCEFLEEAPSGLDIFNNNGVILPAEYFFNKSTRHITLREYGEDMTEEVRPAAFTSGFDASQFEIKLPSLFEIQRPHATQVFQPASQVSEDEQNFEEWTPTEHKGTQQKKKEALLNKPIQQKEQATSKPAELTYSGLFKQIKNTNMPKKLLKMFKNFLKLKLRTAKEEAKVSKKKGTSPSVSNEFMKNLVGTIGKLERKNTENVGIKDLAALFCGEEQVKYDNRKLMKSCLSELIFDEVLRNDNIPLDNKFSYLKCLKTMEWRMRVSDDNLVTRVQSNF